MLYFFIMEKLLKVIEKYFLLTLIFLLPITVLPVFANPYVLPKLVLLVAGVSILLILWCVRVLVTGRLEFSRSGYDIPVLITLVAFLASAWIKTPNKMEAILLPGTATTVIASALLFFIINQQQNKKGVLQAFLLSGAFFGLVTLLSAFDVLRSIPQLPEMFKQTGFTPEGGFLPAALFLAPLFVLGITKSIWGEDTQVKIVSGFSSIVITLALVASVINIIPGSKFAPKFPSYASSWGIAIDAIKDSPLLGVGPGNYLTAFNRFRPLSINGTDLWAVKFATGSNFYLTLFTETGLLGITGFILLLFVLYKETRKEIRVREDLKSLATLLSAVTLLALLLFFPATLLITVVLFILFALAAKSHKTVLRLTSEPSFELSAHGMASRLAALLITIPILVIVFIVLFQGVSKVKAEYTFKKALDALSANDAQKTYQYMGDAIKTNPNVDRYHMTAAQVSILIANAVAQKKDVTEADRTTISSLVQTAIAEGKAGVALNPTRSTNWEVLSQIYRAIIPLAKDADKFAIQAASQAVALDPYNPTLRITLGGIYYAQGDFDMAVKVFETAVAAKNNYANAYYNLAFAYREKGDLDKAVSAMSQVVSLLDKNSKDYTIAQKALSDMQSKKKEIDSAKGTDITPPQGEGKPALDPKLNLPDGSEPPVLTPTPSQKPATTVTPLLTPTPTAQATLTPTSTPN